MAEDMRGLIERSFQTGDRLYIGAEIPAAKLSKALAVHAAVLEDGERPLVLYDDTLLGDGSDGFVVTARRICWKNFLEHPRQLRWADFQAPEIQQRSGEVAIGESAIKISDEAVRGQLITFLGGAAAGRGAGRGGFSPAEIVRLAQQHMAGNTGAYFQPGIPEKKLKTAAAANAVRPAEVLVLYDDTVFGSAEDGFVFTLRGLHWKNYTEERRFIAWQQIDTGALCVSKRGFALGAGEVCVSQADRYGPGAAAAVSAVALLASGAAAPGPGHAAAPRGC